MNFIIDVARGILFRMTGESTDNLGGYVLTRPRARTLNNRLCDYWR